MKLGTALQLELYQVITAIGGGGKTSALLTLARELRAEGKKALLTTTTKMAAKELAAFQIIYAEEFNELIQKIEVALPNHNLIALGIKVGHDGKIYGIPADWVDQLAVLYPDYWILVEGDGAGRKPFKAPAAHEPVIPVSTKLVLGVVGVDAIGQILSGESVHRAELVSHISGLSFGKPLTLSAVCKVISHHEGYRKNIPPHSDFIVLVNKVDNKLAQRKAEKLASLLLTQGVSRVVLASLQNSKLALEVFNS